MSTIKSDNSNLILNADGASKEVKIQRNGTEVLATSSDGLVVAAASTIKNAALDKELRVDYQAIQRQGAATGSLYIDNLSSGDIIFRGNGYAERARVLNGGGITFNGDTATANALDDYEEGYWNPAVTCSISGSYNTAASSDTIAYTKVGRVVHIQGYIQITSENSPNGNIRMSLPFTPATLTEDAVYVFANLHLGNNGSTIAGTKQLFIQTSGAYLHSYADDGTVSYITHAEVDTNWQMGFGFSYIAQ
jgi:hypothetical protein